jgi:hypothetical protein
MLLSTVPEESMSKLLSLLLAIGLFFTAAVTAQSTVAGTWELAINGPEGPITAGAVLKQDGDKVTGTLSSPQGETQVAGTITGKTLAVAFTVTTPQGNIDIKVTAEVNGSEMKGMMDFGAGQADFTGKKK